MKNRFLAVLFISVLATGIACAKEPIRVDASSDAAAESSWKRMTESVTPAKRQKLMVAMVQINLAGVNSAYDLVANPELQSFGIAKVKDKVANLNADEIIELGNRTPGVQVQVQSVQ